MKIVLVTRASGFLGHRIIKELLKRGNSRVIAILGRPEDKAHALPVSPNISIFPPSALIETNFGHVDTLIHTAFSRGENLSGLARSIELTEQIIEKVNKENIDSIINISSQGVYKGQKPGEKVDENGLVEPNTAYGLAKWAVENMLKVGCKKHYTNIRMASLSANARFLDFFVDSVMTGKDITVTAPHQYASIMDVSDAVSGILSILELPVSNRSSIYNLGPGLQYSILDYAESANIIGQQFGLSPIDVRIEDDGKDFATCMNCEKIHKTTGWTPKVTKDNMLLNIYKIKFNHYDRK